MKINITIVLLILGAYFLSTGISYAAFSALSSKDSGLKSPAADKSKITPVSKASKFKLDPKIPKEELKALFYEIPQAQILGLEDKIPRQKTSLVDVQMFIADKRVIPFKTVNPELWYLYIIN